MNARTLFGLLATLTLLACAPPMRGLMPLPAATTTPSAAPSALTHSAGVFVGRGGARLFEQSWRPAEVRAALIVHHGLRSHSAHYAPLAERLAAHGVATYAFDMRGHGRSSGQRATLTSFDDLVDDLAQFEASVRRREPGRPVFLLGHSVGGAVVSLYTVERRPALAGLIVLAPALRIDRSVLELAATPTVGLLSPYARVLDTPNAAFSRDPEVVREMDRDPLIFQESGPAVTAASLLAALSRVWAGVDTVDVPVLGAHGTADTLTDPRGTAEFTTRTRNPDHQLLLYRGLSHDLVREPEREHVMRDLARWISTRIDRGASSGAAP